MANWPMLVQVAFTLAVVVPMGPLVYRLAYQLLASASTLVLLIVLGWGALCDDRLWPAGFWRRGVRTEPFTDLRFGA